MRPDQPKNLLDKTDHWIAAGISLAGLIIYLRTLAPDILFGDSAEFQTLAYTLGITHTTGYPVYLIVVRALGLLPIQTFAWRVNATSALFGALTLAGIYLLARQLTTRRLGGILASAAVALGYTFWSQAIIAEVYTASTLTVTGILLLLWRWHEAPAQRNRALFFGSFLVGIGIHTTVELLTPAIAIFALWTLASHHLSWKDWKKTLLAGIAGAAAGAAIFFLAFFIIDQINTPASFINVTLIPSRSAWGASLTDLDTYFKRVYATVVSLQWRGALFSGDPRFMWNSFTGYIAWMVAKDFTLWMLLVAAVGAWTVLRRQPRLSGFLLIAFFTLLFFIVNYQGNGKDVFYLVTYVFISILMGAGAGSLLDMVQAALKDRQGWINTACYWATAGVMGLFFILPFATSRIEALKAGKGTFVDDPYTYPLDDLTRPRQIAMERLKVVPDDAILVLDWQTLYATCYVAVVEQGRTSIRVREGSPYPSPNRLPDTLVDELKKDLQVSRPVYIDHIYDNVYENFNVKPVRGTDLRALSLR